jgi:hypothetical protein
MKRSSTKERPEPTFFTDRDLGPVVAEQLLAGGMLVEPHHKHFPDNPGAEDSEWLQLVGDRGWVALTHNTRIRYERDQLDDLMNYGATTFFIIGKGPQNERFAPAILAAMNKMKALVWRRRETFIAKVFVDRPDVELWLTHSQWKSGRELHQPRPRGSSNAT